MIKKYENKKMIKSEKDLTEYINKLEKYAIRVSNGEISPESSLNSLIKCGICDKDKNINEVYRMEDLKNEKN